MKKKTRCVHEQHIQETLIIIQLQSYEKKTKYVHELHIQGTF